MEYSVTSIKLDREFYNRFKELSIRRKLSLQDFVNKCLERYLKDETFADDIQKDIQKDVLKKTQVFPNLDSTIPFKFSDPEPTEDNGGGI